MNTDLLLVLGLLISAIAMFAINRPRMDAVALIMLAALPLTGVISMNDALAGFADANIVLIAALFVIGDGLVRTGVARRLGDWLTVKAGKNDILMLVLLMTVVCGLGSMMSSTAVTAIFIPVALRIAQGTGKSPGQLMMPLSTAALISGMTTLVATAPNLVVNSELIRNNHAGFAFFSFTPFGLPILVVGIAYMIFARRWLPTVDANSTEQTLQRRGLADWIEEYKLAGREYRLRIPAGSPLVGKTLQDLDLRKTAGANVIAIERVRRLGRDLIQPTAKMELQADDTLLIDLFGGPAGIETLRSKYTLEALPLTGEFFSDRSQEIGMAEVMVADDASLLGKTVIEATFFTRLGLRVIGMKRGRKALDSVQNERLAIGDTLLVVGPWKHIERLEPDDAGVLVLRLPVEINDVLPVPRGAWQAVACLLLVVGLMISGVIPNVQAALIGCLLMGLFGCVDLNSAYRAIDWKTIVLIVGMLPFSIALQKTGGVELMANGLTSVVGNASPHLVLASLFAITAMLGLFISNTATAVLMAPVALTIARDLGYSPYPFAMIVALAASTAFMTPVSSPVNTLVVAPGNYSFGDFVRIGTPLGIMVMIICVLLVPIVLPLSP